MKPLRLVLSALVVVLAVVCGGQSVPDGGVLRTLRKSPCGQVRVIDYPSTGLRCLDFPPGRALQSCMDLRNPTRLVFPYTRGMVAALALQPDARSLLAIGLGGASLPRWVQRFFPRLQQDLVELDPEVITVAREFFSLKTELPTRVVAAEGRDFLTRAVKAYDVIWLDAFGPDDAPYHLTTIEFFGLVSSRLRPGGVVAVNVWGPASNPSYQGQLRTIQAAFPETYVLSPGGRSGVDPGAERWLADGDGARVVLGCLGPRVTRETWAAQAAALASRHQLDLDLAALVRAEHHLLTGVPLDAPLLHDRPPSPVS